MPTVCFILILEPHVFLRVVRGPKAGDARKRAPLAGLLQIAKPHRRYHKQSVLE